MSSEEKKLLEIERRFAASAGKAFAEARRQALAAGEAVVYAEGSYLYKLYPSGRKRRLKQIEPSVPMKRGSVFMIQ